MKTNKIKVAHIITLLEFGGAQRNTLYTVSHLARDRFEPILIAGKGAFLDSDAYAFSSISVYFINSLKRQINLFYDIIALIKLIFILRKEKPDIVHTHSSKAGILGRWAAFFARVPVIIHTYHGFGFNEYQNRFIHYLFVFIERITAWITDGIICVSSANISYALSKKIGDTSKYHLIRSGISLELYAHGTSSIEHLRQEFNSMPDYKVLTMIACFKPQKNCLDFVRLAYELVFKKDMKSIKFILIGDGEQRKMIECEIERNNLSGYFLLPGWRRDVPQLLRITDIFVLTSLWEGLPRAAVEALVTGVPVVAYAVDGLKEIIRDGFNGYLTEPHNIENMAEKISEILKNPSLHQHLSRNASISIGPEFDIDTMVREQEKLYQNLLTPH